MAYPAMKQMEVVLSDHEQLDNWFINVKKRDHYECCQTHIEYGLRCSSCTHTIRRKRTFKQQLKFRKTLICLGKPIIRTYTFQWMRILIDTNHLRYIEEGLIRSIQHLGYRIIIKEIGPATHVIQNQQYSPFALHWKLWTPMMKLQGLKTLIMSSVQGLSRHKVKERKEILTLMI